MQIQRDTMIRSLSLFISILIIYFESFCFQPKWHLRKSHHLLCVNHGQHHPHHHNPCLGRFKKRGAQLIPGVRLRHRCALFSFFSKGQTYSVHFSLFHFVWRWYPSFWSESWIFWFGMWRCRDQKEERKWPAREAA